MSQKTDTCPFDVEKLLKFVPLRNTIFIKQKNAKGEEVICMETKPRILYVLKILIEQTDEEHPLSTNQLIDELAEEYEISVHRTTITKDISMLQDFGIDIVKVSSTQSKYFVGNRRFELPELKLLIDAVESSKFITAKKTEMLIEKITSLVSRNMKEKLSRQNYLVNLIKPDNEQIYYIVDVINEAINRQRQITFQYYEYNGQKEKVLRGNGEVYRLSPYHLVWSGDYYYVLGYSEKRNKVISFRVDRIASVPEITRDKALPKPGDFNLWRYTRCVFNMFWGEIVRVELCCDNSLMKVIIDRFGEEVVTIPYDETSFRVFADVAASPTFFAWVFEFGGKIRILGPESVRQQYIEMIKKAGEQLEN